MDNKCGRTVCKCVGLVIGFGRRINWPCSWSCVKVGREVGIRERFSVGRVVGLVRVVQFGKRIGHVVGFGVFVGHTVWKIVQFVILLVTDRKMIARKQVLVVLLGLNLIDCNKKRQNMERTVGRVI